MSSAGSVIQRLKAKICSLLAEYKQILNTETKAAVRGKKREEISNECAGAARSCLELSAALPVNYFAIDALNFAMKGFHMNPSNIECCDILIKLFEMEMDDLAKMKSQYLNDDEETVLKLLVSKDVNAFEMLQ